METFLKGKEVYIDKQIHLLKADEKSRDTLQGDHVKNGEAARRAEGSLHDRDEELLVKRLSN